jgi:hypothetical protein
MDDPIKSILTSTLLRALQAEPLLSLDEGIERVSQLVPSDTDFLRETGKYIRRHGVLNPNWLATVKKMGIFFYLVNAPPGWLRLLVDQAKDLAGLSHYVLYGVWDSLIVLHGTEEEARQLLKNIEDSNYNDFDFFSASRTSVFHRCKTGSGTFKKPRKNGEVNSAVINRLVDDYDDPTLREHKLQLEADGIFLGSVLEIAPLPSTDITAFVGIRLGRGSHSLRPDDVLDELFRNEILKTCIVHFVEIDRGYPFHYLAKLVCRGLDELDRATDAISFCRVGRVTLDGNTFVVARGKQEFPKISLERSMEIGLAPDLHPIEDVAVRLLRNVGTEFITKFNELPVHTQLLVLQSLNELSRQLKNRCWDDEAHAGIQSACDAFSRIAIEGRNQGSLVGPVMELATIVEGTVQTGLRQIIEIVYGKDFRKAQDQLKLPTKKIDKLSLGKAAMALRTIKLHADFSSIADALDDNWLKRLERFAEARNVWAHAAGTATSVSDTVIDEAQHVLIEGIELTRWICADLSPTLYMHNESVTHMTTGEGKNLAPSKNADALDQIKLKPRGNREFGIFLSHSSLDVGVAKRIAEALRAMGYPVFYSDWAIAPSQSIVERINEELARNDTLIVLLSPNSVQSRWVQRELNTALRNQLSGEDVTVLPILIAECDIPATLMDIKYIDLRQNFQDGFIQLLEFLQNRFRK